MNSVPWSCSGKGCEQRPSFTLIAQAVEVGKSHGDRRRLRVTIGHFCERCLKRTHALEGKALKPVGQGA